MKVLVTSYKTASDRIALAALRGLSMAGHTPWLGTDDPSTPAGRSRHCRGVCELPNPIADARRHAAAVMDCVRAEGFDTVLPTDDYAVFALSQAVGEGMSDVPLPVPPLQGQQRALDKADATKLAAKIGLRVPETQKVKSLSDLRHALNHIRPPWVVKLNSGGGSVGLLISEDAHAVVNHFEALPDHGDPVYDFTSLVVQSYIPGWTEDAYVLMHRGQAVRGLAGRRLLCWPNGHGSGVLVKTIAKPGFFDGAVALLEALEWHGPADIEFRIDSRDSTPYFIEINGRLWGSTALSVSAGVNFPALSCEMAIRNGLMPEFSFPEGVGMRFPFPLGLSVLAGSRNKLSIGWQLLGPSFRYGSELWWSDPAPGFVQLRQGLKSLRSGGSGRVLSPVSIAQESPLENAGSGRSPGPPPSGASN